MEQQNQKLYFWQLQRPFYIKREINKHQAEASADALTSGFS